MTLARLVIWLNSAVFFLFGLAAATAPDLVAEATLGAAPATGAALIDARATYGGMMMAVGVILAWTANNALLIPLGLRCVAILMGLMAGFRLLGILLDGSPNLMMWIYLGAEAVSLVLALMALRAVPQNASA